MDRKPIKICFVIDALNIGGTEKQLIEIIKNINPMKVQSYLVCLRDSEMLQNTDIECRKLLLDVKSFKSFDIFKKIAFFRSFLIREEIDIVQTFFIDANLLGVITGRLAGVSKIISSRRDMGFWYNKKLLIYLRIVNRFVDRFLVNAEAIKNNLSKEEKVPHSKIDVIYNGIHSTFWERIDKGNRAAIKKELKIPDDHIVVGCVANLNRKVKRVDIFINASAIISRAIRNVTFLIIGDGYLRNEFVELTMVLNVRDKTIFAGQCDDITSLLPIIDIGVLTSDSEGFSNAILEYMAAGIPTVATEVGGNRELVTTGENGLLVPPGDPQSVAESILMLIRNDELRLTMGNNSKHKIRQQYTTRKMIENLESYYAQLFD